MESEDLCNQKANVTTLSSSRNAVRLKIVQTPDYRKRIPLTVTILYCANRLVKVIRHAHSMEATATLALRM